MKIFLRKISGFDTLNRYTEFHAFPILDKYYLKLKYCITMKSISAMLFHFISIEKRFNRSLLFYLTRNSFCI